MSTSGDLVEQGRHIDCLKAASFIITPKSLAVVLFGRSLAVMVRLYHGSGEGRRFPTMCIYIHLPAVISHVMDTEYCSVDTR